VSPAAIPVRLSWALAAFVAVLILQRLGELALSARHARRLRERGGREQRADGFPWLVGVHVLYPVSLLCEVVWLGARPGALWPLWLALWLGAEALRLAAIRALGERWHVRVWVVPGLPLVRHGPYRHLRHPNYLAVVSELLTGPLLFGAWRTACLVSALNLAALRIRIRAEERALREALPAPARSRSGGVS
jgi:methyltransferase